MWLTHDSYGAVNADKVGVIRVHYDAIEFYLSGSEEDYISWFFESEATARGVYAAMMRELKAVLFVGVV